MEDRIHMEMIAGEPNRSKFDMVLDSYIAITLACAGTYDDLDERRDKLCRIRTEETSDTNSSNGDVPRLLTDEEDSIIFVESCMSSIFDGIHSRNSQMEDGTIKVERVRTEILLRYKIHRESTEKIVSPEEIVSPDHKKKSPWVPLINSKVVKAIRKFNLNEWQRRKQLTTEDIVSPDHKKRPPLVPLINSKVVKAIRKFNLSPTEKVARRSIFKNVSTEDALANQLAEDVVVIKERISNGDTTDVEVVYKIRAPYKMRRDVTDQEC